MPGLFGDVDERGVPRDKPVVGNSRFVFVSSAPAGHPCVAAYRASMRRRLSAVARSSVSLALIGARPGSSSVDDLEGAGEIDQSAPGGFGRSRARSRRSSAARCRRPSPTRSASSPGSGMPPRHGVELYTLAGSWEKRRCQDQLFGNQFSLAFLLVVNAIDPSFDVKRAAMELVALYRNPTFSIASTGSTPENQPSLVASPGTARSLKPSFGIPFVR